MEIKPNQTSIATKWALISVLASIVITYIFQYGNIDPSSPLKYLTYLPFIAFLILAQAEYKKLNGGFLSFGEGFSTGFRYAVFTGIMVAIFLYIYLSFLSPEVFEKSLEASKTQMETKGLSDSQIEKAMTMAKNYGPIFGAFFGAIAYAIFGAIVSLVGAAILKKDRSPFDNDNLVVDPAV